jgi:hypothetical protein
VCWGVLSRKRKAVSDAAARRADIFDVEAAPLGSLPRRELWRRMARRGWTASVEGYGVDCHRTWEALLLGGGVVAQGFAVLRELLRGLPALLLPPAEGARARAGPRVSAEALAAAAAAARPDGPEARRALERLLRAPARAPALSGAQLLGEGPRRLLGRFSGAEQSAAPGDGPGPDAAPEDPSPRALLLRSSTWVEAMRASATCT